MCSSISNLLRLCSNIWPKTRFNNISIPCIIIFRTFLTVFLKQSVSAKNSTKNHATIFFKHASYLEQLTWRHSSSFITHSRFHNAVGWVRRPQIVRSRAVTLGWTLNKLSFCTQWIKHQSTAVFIRDACKYYLCNAFFTNPSNKLKLLLLLLLLPFFFCYGATAHIEPWPLFEVS
jgi:hypothetical protein